ncbi:MAG: hypothetical protein AB1515_00685 [Nitrospirota bacterium]
MAEMTVEEARKLVAVVVGPEDIVAKVPEFKFDDVKALLKQNSLSAVPSPPAKEHLLKAKEQHKALIFRIGRDGTAQPVTLTSLKERFGALIYSSWYLKPPAAFAAEPVNAGWALVDLDLLPGSTDRTYDEQEAQAKELGVRLKHPAADVYDLMVAYKATGKFFRAVPFNARTGVSFQGEPIKISDFDKNGLCISTGWGKSVKHADIGSATELILT